MGQVNCRKHYLSLRKSLVLYVIAFVVLAVFLSVATFFICGSAAEDIRSSYSELVSRINSAPLKKSKSKRLEDAIAAKEKELAKIMRYKQALYQDWKDGEITRNEYRHMSEDYERQAEALNNVLRTLTDEQEQLENGVDAESPFLTAFLKYQNIDKLTREILAELIDYIKVYEGGNISVKFKYADEFRRMAEYIELNAPMVQEAAG